MAGSVVQYAAASGTSVAFPSSVTAGNTIIVRAYPGGGPGFTGTVTSPSDGVNTYSSVSNYSGDSARGMIEWYAYNVAGGMTTVTLGTAQFISFSYIEIEEITGILTGSSPLDQVWLNSTQYVFPGTSSETFGPTGTLSQANELITTALSTTFGSGGTPPGGYTTTQTTGTIVGAFTNVSSTSPVSVTWSFSGGDIYTAMISTWLLGGSPPPPPAYTLTAGEATFALTGESTGLTAARKITAGESTFSFTGENAGVYHGHLVTSGEAAYTFTGESAGVYHGHVLGAGEATYSLTGESAGVYHGHTVLSLPASFSLTGENAGITAARKITAGEASYTFTGEAAGLFFGFTLSTGEASYTLTGENAGLFHAHILYAGEAQFIYTGKPAVITFSGVRLLASGGPVFNPPYGQCSRAFDTTPALSSRVYDKFGSVPLSSTTNNFNDMNFN